MVDKLFAVLGSPEYGRDGIAAISRERSNLGRRHHGRPRWRYTAGADAAAYMAARSAQDDATFIGGVKAQFGLASMTWLFALVRAQDWDNDSH